MASRAERRRHEGPYDAAIPLTIATRDLPLAGDVLAEAEEAAGEVARFDQEAGSAPVPHSGVLRRSDSAASSQIENLTASARAIAEAEIGASDRANATVIVANVQAMRAAIGLAGDLSGESILAIHRALLQASEPEQAGRWRTEQVWIGGSSVGPHEAMFVPPRFESVDPAIEDLVAFLRRDDLPVLPQAAVAHAQFETIHPFTDGNGRTVRALLHSLLYNTRLSRSVTVPISAGLLTDIDAYFAALTAYREGDVGAIVRQLARAAHTGVTSGRALLADLRDIRRSWTDRVTARRDLAVWRVADLLLSQPVVNASVVAKELKRSRTNIYGHLDTLERVNILVEGTDRRRDRIWRAPEVLAVLDAFAARAGRRS